MNALLRIRVQKLFAVAVFLKVASAFFGWYLQLQWSLGLILPLLVMVAYIALGLKRQDRDVTDEKFADSCYYLGFIFTITSIVFSLFDLPHIGERIQDIAVRFGAAMVSTVLGLAVRVYLVSFRPDSSDALKDAEDAVLEAAQKFCEQLVMAYEKLGDFQSQVTAATQTSVEAVKLQVEKLTQDHSERMERVFVELNERNQQAVTQALSEVSTASSRMAQSVDGYAESMKSSLQSLGDKVDSFGDAVTQRLKTTTFPDDYFASRLAAPLEQFKAASSQVSEQVQSAASGASEAATVLAAAIRKLKTKATQAEESLDTVVRLTTAQHSLFDTSAAQLEQLKQLGVVLAEVQLALQASATASAANATGNEEVRGRVTAVVSAVEASQKAVVDAMGQVSSRLDAERDASNSLGRQVQSAEAATKELAQELRSNSAMAQQLADKLEADASTKPELAAVVAALQAQRESISTVLSSLDSKASGVTTEVSSALNQLRGVSERLDALMSRLVARPAPAANPVFAAPTSPVVTPSQQSLPPGSTLVAPPVQPTLDTASRPAGLTPSVSYFPGPPPSTPGTGTGGGSGSGTTQG
jgi:hypothetical protein